MLLYTKALQPKKAGIASATPKKLKKSAILNFGETRYLLTFYIFLELVAKTNFLFQKTKQL